jgi:hypothetical protein
MVILIKILLLLICVAIVAFIVDGLSNKKESEMSFGEALDLTGLPIVTFTQGEHKLNFLLDSGANKSVINSDHLKALRHTPTGEKCTVFGMEGNSVETYFTTIPFTYKNRSYTEEFQVVDLNSAINQVKAESGVNFIGIIGNSFLQKYKYVLDFDENKAYTKK